MTIVHASFGNADAHQPGVPTKAVGIPFIVGFALANVGFFIAVMTPIAVTLAIRVSVIDPVGKGGSLAQFVIAYSSSLLMIGIASCAVQVAYNAVAAVRAFFGALAIVPVRGAR